VWGFAQLAGAFYVGRADRMDEWCGLRERPVLYATVLTAEVIRNFGALRLANVRWSDRAAEPARLEPTVRVTAMARAYSPVPRLGSSPSRAKIPTPLPDGLGGFPGGSHTGVI